MQQSSSVPRAFALVGVPLVAVAVWFVTFELVRRSDPNFGRPPWGSYEDSVRAGQQALLVALVVHSAVAAVAAAFLVTKGTRGRVFAVLCPTPVVAVLAAGITWSTTSENPLVTITAALLVEALAGFVVAKQLQGVPGGFEVPGLSER